MFRPYTSFNSGTPVNYWLLSLFPRDRRCLVQLFGLVSQDNYFFVSYCPQLALKRIMVVMLPIEFIFVSPFRAPLSAFPRAEVVSVSLSSWYREANVSFIL